MAGGRLHYECTSGVQIYADSVHELPVSLMVLNPKLVASPESHQQRFRHAAPFPHLVIDNFFSGDFARSLTENFPAFEAGNAMGDDGQLGGKSTFDRIRKLGSHYATLDSLIQSSAFLNIIEKMTGIDKLLFDPFYLGGGTHENRDGMSLDAHVDFNYHASERWHRRLNLIVYLNNEWDAAWGGSLQLWRDPHARAGADVSVTPLFNRAVIFETSERSWHGFDRINLPAAKKHIARKSIALYFYTHDRPAHEIAGRHSTVYVKQALPEHFAAGRVLTESDIAHLQHLIDDRDRHITMQYAENTRLLQAQDKGFSGKVLYLMRRAYVRMRR
jgi:2OG-Fe(II) oxygenase superfamily